MIDKKQPSNRQLKIGQQIRFLVSSFFVKEDFIFENFDWVFISNFDSCNDEKIDLVRWFISFIDIAYVEKAKVKFFFNKVKEKDLYSGDRLEILWRRCQSRLIEMQTFEYLNT